MYIRSDGIYKRPYVPKTLTDQYAGMDNAPREPLFTAPLNIILPRNGLALCDIYVYGPGISADVTIAASTLPPSQEPPGSYALDTISDLNRLAVSNLIQLTISDLI